MQSEKRVDIKYLKGIVALVVEDDFGARQLLIHMLRSMGVESLEAETGEIAQDMMSDTTVDIMLLDIALGPGISGLQLGYNLKQEEQHKTTPVVAVTAFSKDKLDNLMEMGFNDYLPKPYTVHDLQTMLDKYLKSDKDLL